MAKKSRSRAFTSPYAPPFRSDINFTFKSLDAACNGVFDILNKYVVVVVVRVVVVMVSVSQDETNAGSQPPIPTQVYNPKMMTLCI